MSENEQRLLSAIVNSKEPEKAFMIALEMIAKRVEEYNRLTLPNKQANIKT